LFVIVFTVFGVGFGLVVSVFGVGVVFTRIGVGVVLWFLFFPLFVQFAGSVNVFGRHAPILWVNQRAFRQVKPFVNQVDID
jgi:hypothetical protein